MNYEREFRDFYDKYARLYRDDQGNGYGYRYYSDPLYYKYIVQPQEKYTRPFIHASRFNVDRLTGKIGYEIPERFPYQEFRLITPYPKPVQRQVLTPNPRNSIICSQPTYRQSTLPKAKLTENDYRDYDNFIRGKQEKAERQLYPQHIIHFTAPSQKKAERNEDVPFQNYLYQSYPNDYQYMGLSPIKSKIIQRHALSINPYSDKIGGYSPTQLASNPIVYPLNTQKQITKRMYTPTPFGSVGDAIIRQYQ